VFVVVDRAMQCGAPTTVTRGRMGAEQKSRDRAGSVMPRKFFMKFEKTGVLLRKKVLKNFNARLGRAAKDRAAIV
jgi:hypothetical protein